MFPIRLITAFYFSSLIGFPFPSRRRKYLNNEFVIESIIATDFTTLASISISLTLPFLPLSLSLSLSLARARVIYLLELAKKIISQLRDSLSVARAAAVDTSASFPRYVSPRGGNARAGGGGGGSARNTRGDATLDLARRFFFCGSPRR